MSTTSCFILLRKTLLFSLLILLLTAAPISYSLAQMDPEESYDPFTDYSEFDEASDEEADINFFRNGRFFTVGLAAGPRLFTENMAKSYGQGPAFGLMISYFFDMRLAFSMGLMTGDNSATLSTIVKDYSGSVSFTSMNFNLKYFLNTQNVTKGLADLNPYVLGGFSQHYRSYNFPELDATSRESTMGTDFGAGLEIPLMRRKAFLALQVTYHYINFADENKEFLNTGLAQERLINKINGDLYDFLIILGMNF
ncbi:MAG: hypothetical protein AABY64_09405 [Bdellovibrionota bacterium]